MYISNLSAKATSKADESPTLVDVYFDDVVMTHTKGNLIQYNEYYPFGMQTANSWTRENTTGNNFLGNGGTELNTTSNLYDLDYRNYDPILGRMNGVDPMATKYASLTPYNFSFNDPVTFNDPSGADPDYGITRYTYDDRVDHYRGEFYSGGSTSAMSFHFGGGGIINWSYGIGIRQIGNSWAINWNATGEFGGTWNDQTGYRKFTSGEQSLAYGMAYNDRHNSWTNTSFGSAAATEFAYIWAKATGSLPVRETVSYWMNTRSNIVSSQEILFASTRNDPTDGVLGILNKVHFLALRIALHLPDAIAVSGNINMLAGLGFDLTFGGSGYIKMLTGSERGSASQFDEYARAIGWDMSAGISFSELFFVPEMAVNPVLNDFSGKRYSMSVGWGGFPFFTNLDISKGISYAESIDSSRNLRGYSIGISTFYGFGDPGPSFNFNVGSTRFRR